MFTMDLSSAFLHLLQICLHAPKENEMGASKYMKQPPAYVIKMVHRYLNIPVFMYCRLFVLPFIVWYSALFESQGWLTQMDFALFQGIGNILYLFFNTLIAIVLLLNLVLFQRLLYHPKVQSILDEEAKEILVQQVLQEEEDEAMQELENDKLLYHGTSTVNCELMNDVGLSFEETLLSLPQMDHAESPPTAYTL
eukprot:CAMPEP_0171304978 /NCGR_PEP_ID=MMETSP0816-20121228/14751_1 /TAXON_ID=420281 /ORGANISM="Proboscia inermis, Strain CCAP1064/1" /LENGTH=194 /DNA_ID=CAMNT_0011785443 /DNA_START=1 /DNA_END=585 /DNA_ORIENTATION=+